MEQPSARPGGRGQISDPAFPSVWEALGTGHPTVSDNTLYQSDARTTGRDTRANPRAGAQASRAQTPTGGERLTRRRRTQDPFYVDPRVIPQGMSYEWKRQSIFGQPDNEHWIGLRENHWKPVPAERHPELAVAGESVIKRGGTVLCERPKYLTEEAALEDIGEGLKPVQHMEEVMFGTKPGEMTRNHPSVRRISAVRQQYAPGEPVTEAGDGLSAEP